MMLRRLFFAVAAILWALTAAEAQVHPGFAPGFRSGFQMGGFTFSTAALYSDLTQGSLPAWLTASGGANGTRVNAAGNIVAASAPRFDYTGGFAQGLLIEEARTNLFLQSQSPATQTISVTNGTIYTISVQGTGSLTASGAGTGTATASTPLTFTASTTSLLVTVSGSLTIAQVEAGSFKTSPIFTTTATVTRSADVVMGVGPMLALLQGNAASTVFEISIPQLSSQYSTIFSVAAGASTPYLTLAHNGANVARLDFQAGATAPVSSNAFTAGTNRAAASWVNGGQSVVLNNGSVATAAGSYTPNLTTAFIGANRIGGEFLNGYIRKIAVYSSRIPDATLQANTASGAPLP